jgi:hypothetical protein
VEVELRVDRVFKGDVPGTLEVIDTGSYFPRFGDWHGGAGACGSFDADPAGSYIIAGLVQADDGTYRMNRLRTFFLGRSPSGVYYEEARARLSGIAPPKTGSAGLLPHP